MIDVWLRDMVKAAVIVLLALGSWLLPETRWAALARSLAKRKIAGQAKLTDDELATIRVIVGDRPSSWIQTSFLPDWCTQKYLAWMFLLANIWPGRWQASEELVGNEHIEAALAQGKGAILLTSRFVFKDLMTKVSLARAGHKSCQLSRESHGFSDGPVCRRLLNPICNRIEDRFLGERLIFKGQNTKAITARIKQCLEDNKLVLVAATPLGRRVSVLPFLDGQIQIATGALNFACDMEAPVLPSFTLRAPDGKVRTIVGQPLERPTSGSREMVIDMMLADYVRRLEAYVSCNPDQFAFPTSSRHGEMMIQPTETKAKAKAA